MFEKVLPRRGYLSSLGDCVDKQQREALGNSIPLEGTACAKAQNHRGGFQSLTAQVLVGH